MKKHGEEEMRKKYLSEAIKRDAIEKGLQTGGIKFVADVFFTTLYSVWEMVEVGNFYTITPKRSFCNQTLERL